uniref:DDE-1 domain-containing protein n=1 Tax=Acrobeloides nanus TaxID=290746 RepID=A0A914CUE7_9BILA
MKEFRGGIVRLFEQGKSSYQISKDMKLSYTTTKKWAAEVRPIYVWRTSHWSILENEACSKPHQSIEALKKSLVKAWNAIPQEVIDRAMDDFPKRLKKCVDAQGGYFENK